jgi:hypothetical protein
MLLRLAVLAGIVAAGGVLAVSPAQALSMKDCSVKYKAAQQAGTLDGMKWNDFRKAECGPDAKPATANSTAASTAPARPSATKKGTQPSIKVPGSVAFPDAIAAKYANETGGLARLATCLDQFFANEHRNNLGGLGWWGKGGYYSLCNARLKTN